MIVKRNNICYVDIDDILFMGSIPSYVGNVIEKNKFIDDKFVIVDDDKAINFFLDKDFIFDYDVISNLSRSDLNLKILEIDNKLEELSLHWLNGSYNMRRNLNVDKEYQDTIKSLKYMLKVLRDYSENKFKYDDEFSKLDCNIQHDIINNKKKFKKR